MPMAIRLSLRAAPCPTGSSFAATSAAERYGGMSDCIIVLPNGVIVPEPIFDCAVEPVGGHQSSSQANDQERTARRPEPAFGQPILPTHFRGFAKVSLYRVHPTEKSSDKDVPRR